MRAEKPDNIPGKDPTPSADRPRAPLLASLPRLNIWIRLPQKTTLILVVLLAAVVISIAGIFFFYTRSMLQTSQRTQVSTFTYGVAATLGDVNADQEKMQIEFAAL